jgi:predicted Zn-ribbon and HTH transcriptional regulator
MADPRCKYPQDCSNCGYHWLSRVRKPKECPRCKARMDVDRVKGAIGRPPEAKVDGE